MNARSPEHPTQSLLSLRPYTILALSFSHTGEGTRCVWPVTLTYAFLLGPQPPRWGMTWPHFTEKESQGWRWARHGQGEELRQGPGVPPPSGLYAHLRSAVRGGDVPLVGTVPESMGARVWGGSKLIHFRGAP